jgi:hypothetical protein
MQRGPKIMEPAVYRMIPGGWGGSHYHRNPPHIPLSLGIGRSHRVNVSTLRETVQRYISSLNSKFNVNMFAWKPADKKHAKFLIFVSASVHACFNTYMHAYVAIDSRAGGGRLFRIRYIKEFEAVFKTAFWHESRNQVESLDEKTGAQ